MKPSDIARIKELLPTSLGSKEIRETAEALGLVKPNEELAALNGESLSPSSDEIAEVARRHGFDFKDFARELQHG